jgi:IS1 family transposase
LVYVITLVDRTTGCILGWAVSTERTEAVLQQVLDAAPRAAFYFSDLSAPYRHLLYTPGLHRPMPDKSETYRLEGDNAELRHYLARLARKSRCFSPCIEALRRALKLFVFAWNSRQLHRPPYPHYPAPLIDFLYP